MFSMQREEETRVICTEVLNDLARLRASMSRIRLPLPREQAFSATLGEIENVYRDLDTHAARNLAPARPPRRRTRASQWRRARS